MEPLPPHKREKYYYALSHIKISSANRRPALAVKRPLRNPFKIWSITSINALAGDDYLVCVCFYKLSSAYWFQSVSINMNCTILPNINTAMLICYRTRRMLFSLWWMLYGTVLVVIPTWTPLPVLYLTPNVELTTTDCLPADACAKVSSLNLI